MAPAARRPSLHCDLIELAFELQVAVLRWLECRDVLSVRLSCGALHGAAAEPSIWQGLAARLLRVHPHIVPPPTFARLGIVENWRWLGRLRSIREHGRFGSDCEGDLEIEGFGTVNDEFPASVEGGGLRVRSDAEEGEEQRAELAVIDAMGPMTVSIEMPDAEPFDHFIYVRRGTEGCACYWSVHLPGIYHLRLQGKLSTLRREVSTSGSGADAGGMVTHVEVVPRPDERLPIMDPEWCPGRTPCGQGRLHVGLTLFRANVIATLKRIQLH